jgi:hypothetical protein
VTTLAPVLAQMLDVQRAQSEQMAAITQALAARPMHVAVAAPTVAVTNTVEPTPVSVTNNVSPTPVEMHTHVEPTPISVAAAAVTVNNAVNVTDVAITSMPERQTTTTVDRDRDGEISSTTHVERDVPPKKAK